MILKIRIWLDTQSAEVKDKVEKFFTGLGEIKYLTIKEVAEAPKQKSAKRSDKKAKEVK